MPNVVFVVGLGPGDPRFLTAQAQSALTQAEVLCGYTVYLDLVRPYFPDKLYYSTGMTKEIDRCRWALETARSGRVVALVCSGDAGVYGMASPLLELAEHFPDVTVEVVPGLTAALSGGAVLGALEQHMLNKMGGAVGAASLVTGAGAHPDAQSGRAHIGHPLSQDAHPVGKGDRFVHEKTSCN